MRWTILAAYLLVSSMPLRAQNLANPLPAGDGADIVAVACAQCHNVSTFMSLREGPLAWRATVYDMILRGAQLEPREIDIVVAYLTAHFGPGAYVPKSGAASSLPNGVNRDLVEQRCALCHDLDRITAARREPREWQAIVARMSFLGANTTAEESKRILAYLNSTLGH